MTVHQIFILAIFFAVTIQNISFAQNKSKAVQELVGFFKLRFPKEVAKIGTSSLTQKIENLVIKYGDDIFIASRKVGIQIFQIIDDAGDYGAEAVKLTARYGDDAILIVRKKERILLFIKYGENAAEAMIKHGEVAEPLLNTLGKPASEAFKAVSAQNGRRLAMLSLDGQLDKIGKTPELLEVVANYGDRAVDFIWNNKGGLTVAATLTAFLKNPEPFLNGAKDITTVITENATKPITEVAKNTNWTIVIICSLCIFGLLVGVRMWWRHRASLAKLQ